jgi:tRNA-2-methylthio-N6-dimethylallyladenosine synthase
MKTLFVKTYGCQMNVYDSTRMADLLAPLGYAQTEEANDADLVILNTCHIREKAAEKVYSELGRLRRLKEAKARTGGRMMIAVAGCVAQAEGAEIIARQSAVDMIVGPQSYHRLPEMIAKIMRAGGQALETDFPAEDKFDALPAQSAGAAPCAFLTVQEGCDKFCAFCVVPYTRGSEFSRPVAQILQEARLLVELGAREIMLLGQNVNAYRGAGPEGAIWNLAKLLHALSRIGGLQRLRYTTSHPRDMNGELIAAHAKIEAVMPYLHLPIQSGSDAILEAMNRQHSVEFYRGIVDRIRAARSDIALSSDFIVGFPGESDKDFEATLSLVRQIGYAQAFSFKYSKRLGTPASAARKQIPEDVKSARLETLQGLLARQQDAFNRSCTGRTLSVLFEKLGRKAGQAVGRSPYLQPVHVEGASDLIGQIRDVKILEAQPNSLKGALIGAKQREAALAS